MRAQRAAVGAYAAERASIANVRAAEADFRPKVCLDLRMVFQIEVQLAEDKAEAKRLLKAAGDWAARGRRYDARRAMPGGAACRRVGQIVPPSAWTIAPKAT